jgi:hypothetical protein
MAARLVHARLFRRHDGRTLRGSPLQGDPGSARIAVGSADHGAILQGTIKLDIRHSEPDWGPFEQPKAPEGAPNVLMIVWDDVGYGAMDVFGGPIETPTMRRIADSGLR